MTNPFAFQQFNGQIVLDSSHVRKCGKCRRLIGRKRKSYSYGWRPSGPRLDVCGRCHGRSFRRRERS